MDQDAPRRQVDEAGALGAQGPEAMLDHVRTALEDLLRLLRPASSSDAPPTASEMAERQAAIIAAAREEAAELVATAQADAARIRQQATLDRSAVEARPPNVIDLREALRADVTDEDHDPAPVTDGSSLPPVVRERLAAVDAELRAALAATGDIAQEVSDQIARLGRHADASGRT